MNNDILNSVREMYDESAEYWNLTRSKTYGESKSLNWPVTQKYLDKLKAGQTLLDVGCGNGRLVSGLANNVRYLGFDFSKRLVTEAKRNFPLFEFEYGNMVEENTWEGKDMYDAIFSVAVLHHLPEREQQLFVLGHMRDKLKEHGFIYISVWNLWQEKYSQAHLDSIELKKKNKRWVEIPFAKKWKRFCFQMDVPYLIDLFPEAKLEIEEIYYADGEGNKSDIVNGRNIVVIAKKV